MFDPRLNSTYRIPSTCTGEVTDPGTNAISRIQSLVEHLMSSVQALANIQQQVSEAEWQVRVNLAAAYRLVAMYGWDDLIFTHLSARVRPATHFSSIRMD